MQQVYRDQILRTASIYAHGTVKIHHEDRVATGHVDLYLIGKSNIGRLS